jgi:hypothetical protein
MFVSQSGLIWWAHLVVSSISTQYVMLPVIFHLQCVVMRCARSHRFAARSLANVAMQCGRHTCNALLCSVSAFLTDGEDPGPDTAVPIILDLRAAFPSFTIRVCNACALDPHRTAPHRTASEGATYTAGAQTDAAVSVLYKCIMRGAQSSDLFRQSGCSACFRSRDYFSKYCCLSLDSFVHADLAAMHLSVCVVLCSRLTM